MIVSDSFWNTLTPLSALLLKFTIMHSHFPLLDPGSTSAIVQSYYKKLRWLKGTKSIGVHVPAQFTSIIPQMLSHAGKISLQLVCGLVTLPS